MLMQKPIKRRSKYCEIMHIHAMLTAPAMNNAIIGSCETSTTMQSSLKLALFTN